MYPESQQKGHCIPLSIKLYETIQSDQTIQSTQEHRYISQKALKYPEKHQISSKSSLSLQGRRSGRALAILNLSVGDGTLDCSGDINVEVRPVDAMDSRNLVTAQDGGCAALLLNTIFFVFADGLLLWSGGSSINLCNTEDGLDRLSRRMVVVGLVSETSDGESTLGPAVVDGGKVPFDDGRVGILVELVGKINETLDGSNIDIVDRGEIENDGTEDRTVVFGIDDGTTAWSWVIPWAVTNLGVVVDTGAASLLEDELSEFVEIVGLVEVVESLGETVDKDAGVWVLELDLGVRAIVVIDGQESLAGAVRAMLEGTILLELVLGDTIDADASEDRALSLGQAEEEEGGGGGDGEVDAVLDVGEEGEEDTGKENKHLERRYFPELVDNVGRGNEINDSVDNEAGQGGHGNVEEDLGQGVESQEDDDGSEDTGERSANTSLRLDGGTGKGSSCGVSTEEGTQEISEAHSDQFLRGIDNVVVDSAKRLGDGDVLDNQDND